MKEIREIPYIEKTVNEIIQEKMKQNWGEKMETEKEEISEKRNKRDESKELWDIQKYAGEN